MQATTRTQYVRMRIPWLACRGWGPGMVPFTDNLLRACRKLAIKLEDSMRFQGRVFLSEIGSPEHDYSHLLQLFGERLQRYTPVHAMSTCHSPCRPHPTTANTCIR